MGPLIRAGLPAGLVLTGVPNIALAAGESINKADSAWVLTASVLVLMMTLPGLALFYGGLVRARNVLSVLMNCFAICAVASLLWVVAGYSLAFSGTGPWIGDFARAWLAGLTGAAVAPSIPEVIFAIFQMTFAIITPALILGAYVERASFAFTAVFSSLWLMAVYVPVAHWVWGGGYFTAMGVLDFAGGIVVHTTAGLSALVCAVMVGARSGFPKSTQPPHSPGMTMTGAALLWVGWYGFNGGSALRAEELAANAILATHISACAAAVTWSVIEWIKIGKPTSVGIVTGAVAGLATVTPASGYIGLPGAMLLGVLGSLICFPMTIILKQKLKIDDTLDVFAVHGVGGILGSVLVGVLGHAMMGGTGFAEGRGMLDQVGIQVLCVLAVAIWSTVASMGLIALMRPFMALRVTPEQEFQGLDIALHGERAYDHT